MKITIFSTFWQKYKQYRLGTLGVVKQKTTVVPGQYYIKCKTIPGYQNERHTTICKVDGWTFQILSRDKLTTMSFGITNKKINPDTLQFYESNEWTVSELSTGAKIKGVCEAFMVFNDNILSEAVSETLSLFDVIMASYKKNLNKKFWELTEDDKKLGDKLYNTIIANGEAKLHFHYDEGHTINGAAVSDEDYHYYFHQQHDSNSINKDKKDIDNNLLYKTQALLRYPRSDKLNVVQKYEIKESEKSGIPVPRCRRWRATLSNGKTTTINNVSEYFCEDPYYDSAYIGYKRGYGDAQKRQCSSPDKLNDKQKAKFYKRMDKEINYNYHFTANGFVYTHPDSQWQVNDEKQYNKYQCSHCHCWSDQMYSWCPVCGDTMSNGNVDRDKWLKKHRN